jgi:hypothetical protein
MTKDMYSYIFLLNFITLIFIIIFYINKPNNIYKYLYNDLKIIINKIAYSSI